jgi:hypothetical protein
MAMLLAPVSGLEKEDALVVLIALHILRSIVSML